MEVSYHYASKLFRMAINDRRFSWKKVERFKQFVPKTSLFFVFFFLFFSFKQRA